MLSPVAGRPGLGSRVSGLKIERPALWSRSFVTSCPTEEEDCSDIARQVLPSNSAVPVSLSAFRYLVARSLSVSTAYGDYLGAVLTLRGVTSHRSRLAPLPLCAVRHALCAVRCAQCAMRRNHGCLTGTRHKLQSQAGWQSDKGWDGS